METNGGVNLRTGFYTDMPICEVSSLSTLEASREYLEYRYTAEQNEHIKDAFRKVAE